MSEVFIKPFTALPTLNWVQSRVDYSIKSMAGCFEGSHQHVAKITIPMLANHIVFNAGGQGHQFSIIDRDGEVIVQME